MAIRFPCPSCRREVQVADEHAGKKGRCPYCRDVMDIPVAGEPPVLEAVPIEPTAVTPRAQPWTPVPAAEPADVPVAEECEDRPVRRKKVIKTSGAQAGGCAAVLGMIVVAGIVVAAVKLLGSLDDPGFGKRVDYGNGEEVFYTAGATEQDARNLGRELQAEQFFDGKGAKSVQLAKAGPGWKVGFVIDPAYWHKDATHLYYLMLGARLSTKAFANAPVEVLICDDQFRTQKSLRGKGIDYGKNQELFYSADIPDAEAKKFGDALVETGYFAGEGGSTVFFQKQGDTFIVSCVVKEKSWEEQNTVKFYQQYRKRFSTEVLGGSRVELRMIDPELVTQKTFPAE